ncbi:HAD-IA family hydrolase [Nonomuraea sp. NPDC050310]|uniref:HAD family hydrolase n=1 Tax=unclassified Nonomuraea TaxID=2593643 RepID=UPI0033F3DE7F
MGVSTALFDLDGTLVDTEARNMAMWRRLLDNHGIDADVRIFMGRRGRDVLPVLFPDRDLADLAEEVWSYERLPDLPGIAPVPGGAALVREAAAAGAPLGLVTSAQRPWAVRHLDYLDIRGLFQVLVTAEDVEHGKPDPEGYLRAARLLEADPATCVVFEDTPAGIAAAKAAGMRCVGVATTHAASELGQADLVVPDLTAVAWPPSL